ncbi:7TM diverse intracellular signaling domain-containing protein [Bernardetia sp. ABR2-2B]|uniref:7TM diverse intracellular signaling domain-containing protein n=1 Tax=Bernardetia sp. ABR2-2B TaxID=3127472 RepID=UPI0030D40E0B
MLFTFKHILLLSLFFIKTSFLVAQNHHILEDKPHEDIDNFEILIDKNYTFEQILTDSTLKFQKNPERYKFETEEYCWFRFTIKNPSVYTKEIYLVTAPKINNTLYFYNYEDKEWQTNQAGIAITNSKMRKTYFHIYLQPKALNYFYVKVKVRELHTQEHSVRTYIYFKSKENFEQKVQFVIVSCIVVCFAMCLFFIYNLYIFTVFRDLTYLYYLIIIVGGVLYIIESSNVIDFVIPISFYGLGVQPDGNLYFYQAKNIINIANLLLIFFGYIQFSRNYLKLQTYLVFWDTIMKYTLYIFCSFSIFFIACSFSKSFYLYTQLAFFHNILCTVIILLIFGVSIFLYKEGYKLARYFLLANTFPLLGILSIAFYLVLYKSPTINLQLIPHIAIILQTVGFAIALVARINLLKDELKEKQLKAEQLEKENDKMLARNRYIELENEHIISEMAQEVNQNADLQQKLEVNQRELTANMLYLYQKNEMLASLQRQIKNLSFKDTTDKNRAGIREIKSTIKNDLYLENDWDKFKIHFEEVHPNFFRNLKEKYPTLTPNEIRLSAYYHLNMSAKEIATLLNINPTSVHRAKSRLNKKMEKANKEKQGN